MPSELPELESILHSGEISYGKWGKLFEEKLREYIGNKYMVVVNSYNSAMLIALAVLGLEPGDEIIASPMSCLASNQPFATQGLKVIWADVDPTTGSICPLSLRSKISSTTKAIFHNHFCGYPGHIDEINAIGREHNIYVVDDAIEAFGSEYKGNKIGNTGADLTVYSFQSVRLPNTIDGGGLAFNNPELYRKALMVRDYGIEREIFRDSNGEISSACDISMPGFGATLSEINSYIGCLQMMKVKELMIKQRSNAKIWEDIILTNYPDSKFLISNDERLANYWVFGILTPDKTKMLSKFREQGFYASGVHLPNNYYTVFKNNQQLSGVEEFNAKFLALPCGWWVNLDNKEYV
jgi:perosamine synthetase